jgi:hypothetical protein
MVGAVILLWQPETSQTACKQNCVELNSSGIPHAQERCACVHLVPRASYAAHMIAPRCLCRHLLYDISLCYTVGMYRCDIAVLNPSLSMQSLLVRVEC